ncbi:LacI family DNA-binding transcriptional regulator [Kibdelosporangium phytohabitans]|uniref:LacI family transcriptional regulator n=1 Tax=Kibdelosporangium phytohabitans TaxID=860235 RepID=A0A0N9I7L1_9PSEU|nr:LacI family DNA-binding transcriptional regulator [Kibdelosporangium phytohabitans]ALG11782.1 LacI family transcriptional regulator [Kibdelosporangium phytohabitans]MBE1463190.1 LacI family transcriptional regulator [Kibdelosporangium phytohabitans]
MPTNSPTLKEVAQRAGVHVTTASRALNPATSSLVNPATMRRVQAAARELRYQPNAMARGLKTSRSMSVGVLLPDLTNPLFPPIVRGIEDVLANSGYTTLIANTDNDLDRQRTLFDTLRARQVDGVIIATARRDDTLFAEAHKQGARMVMVNRRVDQSDIPSVTGDDHDGIAMAVRHLIELGHTRIAHVGGPQHTSTGRTRQRAYRQALDEAGIELDPGLLVTAQEFTEAEGATAARGMFEAGKRPTAIVAANDMIALGCLDVFSDRRMRCPQDISLVGFNDMPFVDRLTPPLSTVHVPHYQIGAEAARMLLDRLANPDLPAKSITLPATLVLRESTSAPKL